MKKIIPLVLILAIIAGCSTESVEDSTSESMNSKIYSKAPQADLEEGESFEVTIGCPGEATIFDFGFPQDMSGNNKNTKDTDVQIQLYDSEIDEYVQIAKVSGATSASASYVFDEAGIYYVRFKIGSGGFSEDQEVEIVDCGCEESFTYEMIEDAPVGTYQFTYTPEENMEDAVIIFTLAQGDDGFTLEGFTNNGKENSQTWTKTMDLEACTTYEWTATLTPLCRGNSQESNVFTDFKVNEISKMGGLPIIKMSCSE